MSVQDHLELLARIAQLWTQADLEYVLHEVVLLTARALNATKASIFLIQQGSQIQLTQYVIGMDEFLAPDSDSVVQKIVEHGLTGWVMHHRLGTIIHDTDTDERWYHFPDGQHRAGSALSLPLLFQDELIGVLTLIHDEKNYFTDEHLRLMTIITGQVALGVWNAQALQQVRAQREQLEAVLHAIPDILLVLDDNETVTIVSDAVESLLGGKPSQSIVGMTMTQLKAMDSVFAEVQQALAMATENKGDWSFEARSDVSERDYLAHIIARRAFGHGDQGYIIVLNDVSTLRNLSRFKDRVLRAVSHDLRTPLVVIAGYTDLLLIDLEDRPVQQQYLTGVMQASERMNDMLNNMLRVEKVRSTPAELHESVNLKTLVTTVMRDIRPLAAHKNIELEMNLQIAPIPPILGDAMMLQQAMENFIGNAIKYTQQGGRVLVKAYCRDNQFNFVVTDNGVGIPSDELPFVFESFYRGNKTETQSGVGLGLSLVKGVIKQHQGDVWVESKDGQGSSFGFWLPLNQHK